MEFPQRAREMLRDILASENRDEQLGVIMMGLIRASAENCQVCRTGYGDHRGEAAGRVRDVPPGA